MRSKDIYIHQSLEAKSDYQKYFQEAFQKVTERFAHVDDISSFRFLGMNTFVDLWNQYFISYSDKEKRIIAMAYALAEYAHFHQRRKQVDRKTGLAIPYIQHALAVTWEVAKHDQQAWVISAALGHDIFEDSARYGHPVTRDDMLYFFGPDGERITSTIEALTEVQRSEREDPSVATLRKIIERGLDNPAVVLIKVCDRLHNMRTISAMPREKQERKAAETYMIYAPLAERFGFQREADELYRTSIRTLNIQRGADSLNKRIREAIKKIYYQTQDNFLNLIDHSISINDGVRIGDFRYPSFHQIYDSLLLRYTKNHSDVHPSKWEVAPIDLPLQIDIIIPDDNVDPHVSKGAQISWVERRLRSFLPIALDERICRLPENQHIGLYSVLEKARRGIYKGGEVIFYLSTSNGIPLHIFIFSESEYQKYKVPLSVMTSRNSDNSSIDFALEKIGEIRSRYNEWISGEASHDTIRWFGNLLHGSVPVFISYKGDESDRREMHQPAQSTIADILIQRSDWKRVKKVVVNGRSIDLTTELGLRVPAGGIIAMYVHEEDEVTFFHPSLADHLYVRRDKRQQILKDIENIYLSLSDADPRKERYKEVIIAYGWERLVEPIARQVIPFNLKLILPKKYASSEEFLFQAGLGKIKKQEMEEIRRQMVAYCQSLYRIQIKVQDMPGIKKAITDIFYSSDHEGGIPNLIHDDIHRPYGGETPVLTFYFDPKDPHIGQLGDLEQRIRDITGVISVSIVDGL